MSCGTFRLADYEALLASVAVPALAATGPPTEAGARPLPGSPFHTRRTEHPEKDDNGRSFLRRAGSRESSAPPGALFIAQQLCEAARLCGHAEAPRNPSVVRGGPSYKGCCIDPAVHFRDLLRPAAVLESDQRPPPADVRSGSLNPQLAGDPSSSVQVALAVTSRAQALPVVLLAVL